MANKQIILEPRLVGDITGTFFVPKYQRGYRWTENEVKMLLTDIYNSKGNSYCLQPIVVRKRENDYELIDGQQRLTTLYLLYRYMNDAEPGPSHPEPSFNLVYETRDKSEDFLKSIDTAKRENNIDFWFISEAYETIKDWFEDEAIDSKERRFRFRHIPEYLDENVKVIWYEVETRDENEASSIFTRLNIGKIPLTSAELVKATFLGAVNKTISQEGDYDQKNFRKKKEKKQNEIALQWDNIERELHDDSFWFFLADNPNSDYQTRIDLILDLVTEKPANMRDKYYTFFEIEKKLHEKEVGIRQKYSDSENIPEDVEIYEEALDAQWNEIQKAYLTLKSWYADHELYHKIGFLIASRFLSLLPIFKDSMGKTKHEFRAWLDDQIRKSIEITVRDKDNYADLAYNNSVAEYNALSRLLLLFNVESVRQIAGKTQRFPFDKYKSKGNSIWSLEHIHAQHSEGFRKKEQMIDWLIDHLVSVKTVSGDEQLIADMQNAIDNPDLTGDEFNKIQERVVNLLSPEGGIIYMHTIGNLALLKGDDNAALNNSTFDVKRSKIIQLDRDGKYIPFCTRNVFLKYYTPSDQLGKPYLWEDADRIAYIKAINKTLETYLANPIRITDDVTDEKQDME